MEDQFNFIAISGSLRKGSFNTMTLKAIQKLASGNITVNEVSLAGIPMYNFDLHENSFPGEIEILNNAILKADAVIFITPEYNYSIPGGLKNAIDFVSRSPVKPLNDKPVGIMGASSGKLGTVRAQGHLRQVLLAVNARVMNQPEIMIADAQNKFDEQGNLDDENTKELITGFIKSLMLCCGKQKI